MKICIYTSTFYPVVGGIENFVFLLAKEFTKFGHQVTVLTDIKKITKNKFPFKVSRTNSFFKKINIFKKNDIVLCNNFSFKGVPAALLSGKKFFIVHHSAYHMNGAPFFSKEYMLSYIKTRVCFFFDNIAVSKFVSKSLPVRSKVIFNLYNNYAIKRLNIKKKKDFIFCGRLVSDKGANILINAFSYILKKKKNSFLTIVGDGPEYRNLKEKTYKLGIQKNIEFTGIVTDTIKNKKLNEHFCMVVPSLWNEPFGSVALEGLATTQFVISSNKGGLPEAIKNCGQLVDPNIKKLSAAMSNFLNYKKYMNKNRIKKHLEKCKIKLSNHSCKNVAKEYLSYFNNKIYKQ